MRYTQLIINPGSTSTKLAIYEGENRICQENVEHEAGELEAFRTLPDQVPYRKKLVMDFLERQGIDLSGLSAVTARGGMVWGLQTGGYQVNSRLIEALKDENLASQHASNLGAMIAKPIADDLGIPAFIYDSVTSGSLPEIAEITGFPEIRRRSACHVLNSRAMAMQYAKEKGKDYADMNLLVVHMGGGISLSAHRKGKIVDFIGDDDGPFSPERAGCTQILEILKLCYSGKYSYGEMKKKCRGQGGLKAYLGTSDAREIEKRIDAGDEKAKLLYEAQAYQVAKGIGLLSAAMKGDVDAVILTGGLANSKRLTDEITGYVKYIAPVAVKAGENEMEALALGGLRMLRGEEEIHIY